MFEVLYFKSRRWMPIYGGRGSGKSGTTGRLIPILSMIQKRFIVLARDYKDDVEDSIWKNVLDRIYELGVESLFSITKERIKCLATGTQIIQFGLLDNPEKIKSLEGCDLLIYEESAKAPRYVWEKVIPTIRENGATILPIFNPDWEMDETYDYLITKQDKLVLGVFSRLINYVDNPFCPDSIKAEAEEMKIDDPDRYENIYLGVPKKTTDMQIFCGVWSVVDFDSTKFQTDIYSEEYKGSPKYYNGVQWGISQNPTASVRVCEYGNSLYIENASDSICEIDGMVKVINDIPKSNTYYCSPEQPATRLNINKRLSDFNVYAAEKGREDVLDAITFLRGAYDHIYIHPSCVGVIDNFEKFWWKTDEKTGDILNQPIDKNNWYFHAIRHALHSKIGIGR